MRAGAGATGGWPAQLARARFLLGEASADLLKRDWNAPLQPANRFLERFSTPKGSWNKWGDRVALNSHIYQTNYLLLTAILLAVYVLLHPWSTFLLLAIFAGWYVVLSPAGAAFRAGPHSLAAPVATFALLSLSGTLVSLGWYLLLAVVAVGAHATFRHTSARTKLSEMRERMSNTW